MPHVSWYDTGRMTPTIHFLRRYRQCSCWPTQALQLALDMCQLLHCSYILSEEGRSACSQNNVPGMTEAGHLDPLQLRHLFQCGTYFLHIILVLPHRLHSAYAKHFCFHRLQTQRRLSLNRSGTNPNGTMVPNDLLLLGQLPGDLAAFNINHAVLIVLGFKVVGHIFLKECDLLSLNDKLSSATFLDPFAVEAIITNPCRASVP
mmetsp:Transcript_6064/g.10499  ORF Transcript_6064/g.10499 Transcript_6064/m.10499 type:complete len:204 (-) Transcript_6064:2000-2611(-)